MIVLFFFYRVNIFMKSFLEYILEGNTNKDKSNLRKQFLNAFKQSNININISFSQRAVNEIFRADLGKSEEQARLLLEPICKKLNLQLGEYAIFGRPVASGTFKSFELEFDNIKYYITNTSSIKGILHNKDLVPNKILKNLSKTYISFHDLINNINFNKIENDTIKDVIYNLIDTIDEFKIKEQTNFFNNKKFINSINSEILNEKIVIQNSADLITSLKNIEQSDIQNISKDFGEILQPCIFLKKFDDANVSFPTTSNEALVDYYINGIQFSAKSSSGAAPSGASIFKTAYNNITNGMNQYTDSEKQFIFDFYDLYGYNIFKMQQAMINKFVLNDNNNLKFLLDIGFNEWNTYTDLANSLDMISDKQAFFTELYNIINYHPEKFKTGSAPYTIENVIKEWNKYTPKLKWGILFYPLYVLSIKNINIKYQNILSDVISKTIDMIQCYFDIKQNVLIMKLFKANKKMWKFTSGGMSTANINNAKLSLKMIK